VIKGARASNNQKIYLYDWSGNLIAFAPCSTGKNYGTPLGRYTVVYKKLIMISYSGTLYARYPTYFRKNFAIHGWPRYISSGRFYHYELLGKPASAGCVRVPEEVAKAIWTGSVVGKTRVEILP
jgi:lipoprotein-anchoring transpeptidase ErfK/SrfK